METINYKYVDNVLLKKELFNLYKGLISHNGWNLSRSSLGGDIGTFPGFLVKDGDQIHDNYWSGYFTSLYERIKINFQEKYKYELPNNIFRIHLGAKNESSITEFHSDSNNGGDISILGFLTPVWSNDWGGDLQVEENKINFKPGKFLIFNSDKIHNGVGPNKKIPYWRISINYIVR
jgi:hypothetical protein